MFINLGGTIFHAQSDGPEDAPAVLMLHCLGGSTQVWEPQAKALAKTHRVVRMDIRGHGLSEATEGPYTMALLAGDALALLDALSVRQAHVVGLSIGGRIAMEMAMQAPGRVLSLGLCDTALEFGTPAMWEERLALVAQGGLAGIVENNIGRWVMDTDSAAARGLRRIMRATDVTGYRGAVMALRDCRAATVQGITCATTILVGDKDVSTPIDCAQAIHAAIPGSRLVVLPGAAHVPNYEQEGAMTRTLQAHLAAAAQG